MRGFKLETDINLFLCGRSGVSSHITVPCAPPKTALLDILEIRDKEDLSPLFGGDEAFGASILLAAAQNGGMKRTFFKTSFQTPKAMIAISFH